YSWHTRASLSIYFVFVSTGLILAFGHWFYDDPFITFRYAQNLAQGQGFVYNAGIRVLGTTTPLFALFLAGIAKYWNNLPYAANVIGAASLSAGALLLWDINRQLKSPLPVGLAVLSFYPLSTILLRSLGSEMPLYLLCCVASFSSYTRRHYSTSVVCVVLASLIRADGFLLFMVLATHFVISRVGWPSAQKLRTLARDMPWPGIVIASALVLAWVVFSTAYFGSPIPATLFAKQQQGAMHISQRFGPGAVELIVRYSAHWHYWLAALLAILGVVYAFKRAHPWIPLLIWTGVYFISYCALGVSAYPWYYAPLVPGIVVALSLGVGCSVERPRDMCRSARKQLLAVAASVCLLFVLTVGQVTHVSRMRPDTRFPIYQAIGQWLHDNTDSRATIGTLEVGIIGYYAQRTMIDFAGLIEPEVAMQLAPDATYDDAARWAIARYQPDYLVLWSGNAAEAYGAQHCTPIQDFMGRTYGYAGDFTIYRCNHDVPNPQDQAGYKSTDE
ncbi:MAG: hypothetical protein M1546_22270, partial [Chloroflexi bacterium]|nr:hypothetical protein [Chloroflexota bacterium]